MSFDSDLNTGLKAERAVIKKLQKEMPTLKQVQVGSDYDLIDDNGYTIEVKYDKLSEKTPNVGIEFRCNGKLSGIATTKAMEWVHIFNLDGEWVYARAPIHRLKSFLRSNQGVLNIVDGGDGNRAKLALVNKDDFANHFTYYKVAD
jgi:hypothetical protein